MIEQVRTPGDSGSVRLSVEPEAESRDVLQTTVEVGAGQTAVLGSTRPRSSQGALILAVTPEVTSAADG